ncbi:MAG: DUF6732 family protein [Pseudomonadota bacterium]
MQKLMILAATLVGTAAHAHPGHLEQSAGHSHWEMLVGLAAIALAGTIAWKILARR